MFGFGFDAADSLGLTSLVLRPETTALIARMAAPPDVARRLAMDRLVGALLVGATSGASIWNKLDMLQIYAADTTASALLNWKGGGFKASVGGGAPVFVANRGIWTDGVDDWVDSGFAPSAGSQYQQDSATIGAWFRKSGANAAQPIGTVTSNAVSLSPRNSGGLPAVRVNATAVIATGATRTSGYGCTAATRTGTSVQMYVDGLPSGTAATGASSARSSVTIGIGRQGNTYAEGQVCAFFVGAALSAAEHADLCAALAAYLGAIGVAEIVPTTRTLALASAIPLPDGSAPPSAGKGMGMTGLLRRADGKWYVANGIAGRTDLYWTRMSSDLSTIEAEFRASTLGLSADFQGSVQGMALDTSDNTMWAILKLAGSGGATTYLLHLDLATEALVGAPLAIASSDTGVAYDASIDQLWITRDGGGGAGSLVLYDKTGGALTAPIATPGYTDQCFCVPTTGGAFLAGDVLVSAGANGADGTVTVYNRVDYGGMVARRVDTLVAAQQIEGAVLVGSAYYVSNDGSTHPGARGRNEVLTYAA